MDRRQYVTTTVSVAVFGLAGCTADSPDDSSGNSTESEATSEGSGKRNPEQTVESYLQAVINREGEAAVELVHSESSNFFTDPETVNQGIYESDSVEIRSLETEPVTLEQIAEASGESASAEEIEEQREAVEDEIEPTGASDYSFVRYELETSESSRSEDVLLVDDGGEWLLYSVWYWLTF